MTISVLKQVFLLTLNNHFYHFVDALPLTPVGKVDYRRLEEMANGK